MTPRQSALPCGARRRPDSRPAVSSGALLLLCLLAFAVASCGKHKVPVMPLTFNPNMNRPAEQVEPPELAAVFPENGIVNLVIPPPRPARPAVRAASTPVIEPEPIVPKASPPRISMRLSPAQESDYRQRTMQSIAVAEKNLHSVNSSTLSVPQQDLVEKIRSFLSQSREAIRSGDLPRAHILAQKAQVLSEELISLK